MNVKRIIWFLILILVSSVVFASDVPLETFLEFIFDSKDF